MSLRNPYKVLLDLIGNPPLQVGTVTLIANGLATVELPDGGTLQARGNTVPGQTVFVRDGVIEGEAPALPIAVIEV